LIFASGAKQTALRLLAARPSLSQIAAMRDDHSGPEGGSEPLPRWAFVGGGLLLLLTAVAAPFYGDALAGLMWAGESIKALCGW
jgi:hypothetical protein